MSPENSITEYKSIRKVLSGDTGMKDLAVTCVCFANAQGGNIFIGVEDDNLLPPSDQIIDDDILNKTASKLRSLTFNTGIICNPVTTHDNGGQYFSLVIQPTLKSIATTSDGKIYKRIGDQCQPVRSDEIIQLASEKDAFQWELQPRNVSLDNIKYESINWFASEIRASDRVKQFVKSMTNLEICEHYNLILNNNLTNLGVLWLGTAAQRSRLVYPLSIQYIVYDDNENKVRKEEWHEYNLNPKDLLIDIERKAIELTYSDEFPNGLFRNKIRHYDDRLIRELLINAIAHKSYTISGDIFIKVYVDKLVISNPGGLPLGITKDNILHTTYRRNPHLIRILHDLMLMEGEGSGFDLIYEITCRDSKKFPDVISEYNATIITQHSKILDDEVVLLIDFISKNYTLKQKEFIVLGIVARHKKILATSLTKELQLNDEDRLRSYVSRLLEQAILITHGVRKGTEYLINPKLITSAKINIKPSLKVIEPHVLKALIIEDLNRYPKSKSQEIQSRISDLPIEDIRKALLKMEKDGELFAYGSKKSKTYSVAKKN